MSNDIRDIFKKINELSVDNDDTMNVGDSFDIELSESFVIETGIVGFTEDGIIVEADESMLEFLDFNGVLLESFGDEEKELYGLHIGDTVKTTMKNGRNVQGDVIDIFPETMEVELLLRGPEGGKTITVDVRTTEYLSEAEYHGRKVPLGKPMQGDVKKSKVYVKKPDGKVVKVNFGDKNMRIKKSNPARRKSFRARHNCANPGPRWKARYWSCRKW